MTDKKNFIDLGDDSDDMNQSQSVPEKQAANEVVGLPAVTVKSGNKLNDIFDRFQKMVYVFDISGSMDHGMIPGEIDNVVYWTPEILEQLRTGLTEKAKNDGYWSYNVKQAEEQIKSTIEGLKEEITGTKEEIAELKDELSGGGLDREEKEEIRDMIHELEERIKEIENEEIPAAENPTPDLIEAAAINISLGFDINDTEALKLNTYIRHLDRQIGMQLVRTGLGLTSKRKIDSVKLAAKEFIETRLAKYPEADITVIQFNDTAKVISRKTSKVDLFARIQNMTPRGGTDIYAAVDKAVEECKQRPSTLAANHIVLVTDGDSHSVADLPKLIPTMKEKNIVLDFVFIRGMYEMSANLSVYIEKLKAIAKETGGEVVEVDNAEKLTKKLAEVSGRLLIPAVAGASSTGVFTQQAPQQVPKDLKTKVREKIQTRKGKK